MLGTIPSQGCQLILLLILEIEFCLNMSMGVAILGFFAKFQMCFTPDARGTEYYNSVPAGIEFQNNHECEARGIHFSLGPSA